MKILVIEDDKFLLSAYKIKFDSLGYETRVAERAEAVMEVMKEDWVPDVIVLDIILPEVDGWELLDRIKADDKWKEIPVVVASNLGQDSDKSRAKELGAAGFVVKGNMTLNQLVEKLDEVIKENSSV